MNPENFGPALQQLLKQEGKQAKNPHVKSTLAKIGNCRTASLGYHLLACEAEKKAQGCGP